MEIRFSINGCDYTVSPSTVPLDTTLNSFIRNKAKLTGTKFMCLEGGCGACIVTLCGIHPVTKEKRTWAVNSCLQNVYSCHGLDITTVEGIGIKREGMHKVQKRLASFNGTQCGYCSPGMVMNMYSLLESNEGKVTMKDVENSFGGNICRCTGYRPILDAFKSLAVDATEELLSVCSDIEDCNLTRTCLKTGLNCTKNCSAKKAEQSKYFIFNDDRIWHITFTISEILKVFDEIGEKPYMLVAGNTAHGVYRRSSNLKVFIDISNVEELRSYKINENSLELGANLTLSECMTIFSKLADDNKNFTYLHEVVKHFDLIANVPVRDNGTLAGNLMIKNKHHEFPSDVFLVFETIGASFRVLKSFESCLRETTDFSPNNFMTTNMHKKVLTKITIPAYDPTKFVYRSYKIMPRAQNAHAYVNAAFLLEMNRSKVISSKICFGGINPTFIHAEKTEKCLLGQDLFSNQTLQQALTILDDEINPDWVLPDASSEYKMNLTLSLFYKFVLGIAPKDSVSEKFSSGGEILTRGLSSGTQTFNTYENNWPLTKNIPKIEADVQCTGEAKYINDYPKVSNELHAAFVTAKIVHSVIKNIDASNALKVPGVVAFYSAKDIPGNNDSLPFTAMPNSEMEEIFCESKVRFYNQPVGIIVADSFELANQASEMVKITYEDNGHEKQKKVVATLKDVMDKAPERIELKPESSRQRLVESNIEGEHKISGRFEMENQYHFTMETQTCLCIPIEDGLDVYCATQWMDATQIAISDMLKIQNNHVNMYVRRLGGGFGSKISRANQVACACALAAYLQNRPVRFVMQLEANMNIIGKRYACINLYDVKVDDDGKICELNSAYTEDYGCFKNESALDIATALMKNCYDHRFFNIDASIAVTDAPSNSWCRAPGTVEGIGMIENIMEHIAFTVKKDPFDVRMANIPDDSPMKNYLLDFAKSTDYQQRRNEIDDFNERNRWRKRGISIVPLKYPLNFFGSKNAMVSIYHGDGSVSVTVGGIEMGQGLNTKVAQTAAFSLGIPLEKIQIKPSNSFTSPNAIVTGGSQGSEVSCYAVLKACEILNERLKPIKVKNSYNEWSELIAEAHNSNVDLVGTYMYKSSDLESYNIWAAACSEVEVDVLTGNILINRVDIMEDVGESLSPGIDVGQIEGGFIMGLGYWLTESLVYDRITGELLTNRTWNYKPPGAKDIPIDFRINFLNKSSNPFGVLRSKATGEPSTAMAIVVLCALHHSLDSARKDAGTLRNGYQFKLGAPTTVESTFLAADTSFDQFLLK